MAITSKDVKIAVATGIVAFAGTLILRQFTKQKAEEITYIPPHLEQNTNWIKREG